MRNQIFPCQIKRYYRPSNKPPQQGYITLLHRKFLDQEYLCLYFQSHYKYIMYVCFLFFLSLKTSNLIAHLSISDNQFYPRFIGIILLIKYDSSCPSRLLQSCYVHLNMYLFDIRFSNVYTPSQRFVFCRFALVFLCDFVWILLGGLAVRCPV